MSSVTLKPNDYKINGNLVRVRIKRTSGKVFITRFDIADSYILEKYRIGLITNKYGRLIVTAVERGLKKGTKRHFQLHKVIMNDCPIGFEIDHINNNTLDNRRCNLRIVNRQQNMQNLSGVRKNNKTGIRGVNFYKKLNKYVAQVQNNKKKVHLGYFDYIQDAEQAVIAYREEHMPFSRDARSKIN